jgi:hypothetical protein
MFLVTGTGRSGTSAVARLLHEAGLSVGKDLVEPDEHNAEGYFEERALIEVNQRVLEAAGLLELFGTATREEVLAPAERYHDRMRALAADATPAWKDPRFSWTLEPWLSVLPQRPRIIVCIRNPAEVVASTVQYYGFLGLDGEGAVEHLWRVQYERLIEVIADHALDATCVEYAALHRDPASVCVELSRFVGRRLDPELVRRDLRHHESPLAPEMAALYERVTSLGRAAPSSGGVRGG